MEPARRRLAILASNQYATRDERQGEAEGGRIARRAHLAALAQHSWWSTTPWPRRCFSTFPGDGQSSSAASWCGSARVTEAIEQGSRDGLGRRRLRQPSCARVTRWYRAKRNLRAAGIRDKVQGWADIRRPRRPSGDRVPGSSPRTDCRNDIGWAWYLGQARRKRSRPCQATGTDRGDGCCSIHGPGGEKSSTRACSPSPKASQGTTRGIDVKHPTLLWDWPSYPNFGNIYRPGESQPLVLDIDDPARFRKWVD